MEQLPFDLPSQGARAGRSGRFGESAVEAAFGAYKVRCVDDDPGYHNESQLWKRDELILIRQHQLIANGSRVDFLFMNFKTRMAIPIECKHQKGSGTTDQKLSYTVGSLARSGFQNFWLVLSGGGWNPKVIETVTADIKKLRLKGHRGRIVWTDGSFLQNAIEKLVEKNEA